MTINATQSDLSKLPPRAASQEHPLDLIARLLREQSTLTAVEEFSAWHQTHAEPAQAMYYRNLLPSKMPQAGQQFAFEVDLDSCSGCKACVTACHTLNGLDDEETWRDVGLLLGGTTANPLMQHVTTACHHCIEPACLSACPVDAYVKDPITGIVKHLDDQCFGCQYCTLACPYDVPKYNARKGIVRKCDMCSNRLAVGEAPACVQACPHHAIAIRIVDTAQVLEDNETGQFLPGAPDPHLTHPTTHFKSERVFPRNTLPADYRQTSSQHPHWPLIVMLVLTQLSVGAFTVGQIWSRELAPELLASLLPVHAATALGVGLLALLSSLLHLGRPQFAFRAFIGLRHSWLSREIVSFGLFAVSASAYAGLLLFGHLLPTWMGQLSRIAGWGVVIAGGVALMCSVMIYVVTRREFWSLERTCLRFVLTAALLGTATFWVTITIAENFGTASILAQSTTWREIQSQLTRGVMLIAIAKLLFEAALFRHLFTSHVTTLKRSAQLHIGELANVTLARFAAGMVGGVLIPWLAQTADKGVSSLVFAGFPIAMLLIGGFHVAWEHPIVFPQIGRSETGRHA